MKAATVSRACQLCGCKTLKQFVVPNVTELSICPNCGLYQNGPLAANDSYDISYQSFYAQQRKRKMRTAAVRLNRIASLLDSDTPRMLDIGCSIGVTVEAAARRGWDAVGVDVSEDVVQLCRQNGCNCTTSNGLDLPFEDESFDLITAWHIIEHVVDINKTLAEWQRVLRVGGVIAVETPDASSLKVRMLGARYPRFWKPHHTYAFTPATLNAFFKQARFEIMSRPFFGRLSDLSLAMAGYSLLYQSQHGLRRAIGISKAFQIFARRKESKVNSFRRLAA